MGSALNCGADLSGLFPTLLGHDLEALHASVRRAHSGQALTLRGTATIARGPSLLARLLCRLASLPRNQLQEPLTVTIEVLTAAERWTRHFGQSAPMRSTLRVRDGLLVESLGLTTMRFRLTARDGGIDWTLVRIAGLGIPLPCRLFRIATRSGVTNDRYAFQVTAAVVGIGELIRYEGELDVVT
jgi:hypothetical protein